MRAKRALSSLTSRRAEAQPDRTPESSPSLSLLALLAEGGTEAVAESAFCSGDCLFSYLFSRDLLSNQKADDALHFFKRVDTAASNFEPPLPRQSQGSEGSIRGFLHWLEA